MKKGIVLQSEWSDLIRPLPKDEQAELFMAVLDYGDNRDVDCGHPLWTFIKRKLDEMDEKYKAKCIKNQDNIKKRYSDTNVYDGRPESTDDYERIPKPTNVYDDVGTTTDDYERIPKPTNVYDDVGTTTDDYERIPKPTTVYERIPIKRNININKNKKRKYIKRKKRT